MGKKATVSPAGEDAALRLIEGADIGSLSNDELMGAIDALATIKSTESADVLRRIEQPKEVAKAARRALFKLQTQGVRPSPESAPTEESAARPAHAPEAAVRLTEARITSYDPKGTRAIFLLADKPFTGLVTVFAIINDTDGLLSVDLSSTTKKAFFTRLENFQAQFPYLGVVALPPAYANSQVQQATSLNEKSNQPLPQDYAMWKTVAADAPLWEGPPPVYSELPVEDIRSRIRLEETADLAHTEFEAWTYEPDQLKEHLARLEASRGGPLVVSPDAQKERERGIVNEATDAIFQGDEMVRAKNRLEETAFLLLQEGNREAAERCLRAALSVDEPPPHAQPFLHELVKKSIAAASENADNAEGQAEEEAKTDSGIILPA